MHPAIFPFCEWLPISLQVLGLFHESLAMISFQSSFHSASNGFNFSWHPIQDILSFLTIHVNVGLTSQSQVCLVRRFREEFLIIYTSELVILTCNKVQFNLFFCRYQSKIKKTKSESYSYQSKSRRLTNSQAKWRDFYAQNTRCTQISDSWKRHQSMRSYFSSKTFRSRKRKFQSTAKTNKNDCKRQERVVS